MLTIGDSTIKAVSFSRYLGSVVECRGDYNVDLTATLSHAWSFAKLFFTWPLQNRPVTNLLTVFHCS